MAVQHLRNALRNGTHWYIALLEAIQRWDHPRERLAGEWYTYFIENEALDWLLLAERLAAAAWDLLPSEAVQRFLFDGVPPLELHEAQVRDLLGPTKHRAYLNFFYGVTVEEALLFATEQEIRREHPLGDYHEGVGDDAYERIYGLEQRLLLAEFRGAPEEEPVISIDVAEWKRFVYWLFKRRLSYCLPARVASDTKKGLAELKRQYVAVGRSSCRLWIDTPPAEGVQTCPAS